MLYSVHHECRMCISLCLTWPLTSVFLLHSSIKQADVARVTEAEKFVEKKLDLVEAHQQQVKAALKWPGDGPMDS